MSNKEKNTKEEPYLLQDSELDEVEDVTREVPAEKYEIGLNPNTGKFDNPKDFEEFKNKIDKMDSSQSDKLTISNDNETATVDKTQKESTLKNEINLSESDIISIIEGTNIKVYKKHELVETIKNKILKEAQMDGDVRRNFESGENDYSDILGTELTNSLASQSFDDAASSIRQKIGKDDVTMDDVQRLLGTSLMNAAKKEYEYGTDRLEQKAIAMIRKQFNIPNDAVDFEATITGLPAQMLVGGDVTPQEAARLSTRVGVKVGKINREGLKIQKGTKEVPQGKTEEELKPKIKRRRLTNAMMHGAARKSQNLHHLDDQLRQENPQLGTDYSNIMAANDASYFMLNDETIKQQGQQGIHAGNSRVKLSNDGGKPKIIAQGMVFPILLHELSKGVVELMSLWSLPKDRDVRQYVLDKTDNLDSETNDIRLGSKIWEKFVQQIPVDNQEVISLTWNMLQELPDNDFNEIIEGLVSGSGDSQNRVRRISEEALEELRQEASDDAFGGYEDSPEDSSEESPEENNDDEDVLTPPEETPVGLTPVDEPQEVNYENMSKRDLELEIDSALDSGDMELVRYLGSILNKK